MFTSGDFPRLCLWLEGEQEHRLLPVLFLRQNVSAISKSFTSLRTCELEIHLIVQMPIDLLTGLFTLVMVLLQEYQDMPPDMVLIPPFAATHTVFQNIVYTEVLINYHSPQIIEKICSKLNLQLWGKTRTGVLVINYLLLLTKVAIHKFSTIFCSRVGLLFFAKLLFGCALN